VGGVCVWGVCVCACVWGACACVRVRVRVCVCVEWIYLRHNSDRRRDLVNTEMDIRFPLTARSFLTS
jgi:hypothetical protein